MKITSIDSIAQLSSMSIVFACSGDDGEMYANVIKIDEDGNPLPREGTLRLAKFEQEDESIEGRKSK